MKILKRHWLIVILTTLAVAAIAAFQLKGNDNPQYFTAKVDRGDISQVVEATGTINAVTTVQVGSQVSGTVSRLYADFNSRVKRGQVIAQIDPSLFEGSLLYRRSQSGQRACQRRHCPSKSPEGTGIARFRIWQTANAPQNLHFTGCHEHAAARLSRVQLRFRGGRLLFRPMPL